VLILLTTLNVPIVFILSSCFIQAFRFWSFGQRQQDDASVVCTTYLFLTDDFRMILVPLLMCLTIKISDFVNRTSWWELCDYLSFVGQ